MKHSPMCQEQFDDAQRFCDLDGTPLIDETILIRSALQQKSAQFRESQLSRSGSAIVGGSIGILLGLGLSFAVFVALRVPDKRSDSHGLSNSAQPQIRAMRPEQLAAAPRPTNSPSQSESEIPEPEAEATTTEAPAAASGPETQAANSGLNSGPIATGGRHESEGQRAIIKMRDGSSVEADAAWEDSQGIWYRRNNLVSFVQRNKVAGITSADKPQTTSETKTP